MGIQVTNTKTGKKEPFIPRVEGSVSMYVCGPTVYDELHLGNFRCFVVFDTARRFMESEGLQVTYVQNFTDIDDKMIRRANERGVTVPELAEEFIRRYEEDAKALGIKPATIHPRATDHIDSMIAFIQSLVAKGMAYEVSGDVYFRVNQLSSYGELSGNQLDALEAGSRIEVAAHKEHPADFTLWKAAKPGEPAWPSPWGNGRPGWHIECSAMSSTYLGDEMDIHAGGLDLRFPHHENELAQSTAQFGHNPVRYWLHNGMLTIAGGKMSKSLGNFITVRSLMQKYAPEVLRMYLLSAHYSAPLSYSEELLAAMAASYERLLTAKHQLEDWIAKADEHGERLDLSFLVKSKAKFQKAMEDDFNTALAQGVMFELVREIYQHGSTKVHKNDLQSLLDALQQMADVLGILQDDKETLSVEEEVLLQERIAARLAHQWRRADEIRDLLNKKGITIEDTPDGQRWRRKALL